MLWINDFLVQLGYDNEVSKTDVYWCQPGKSFGEGLKLMTCDADIVLMIVATIEHNNLVLVVDHGDTLQSVTTDDVLIHGVPDP